MQVVDIVSSIYSPTGYRRIISAKATASPQARVHNLTRHRNHNPLFPSPLEPSDSCANVCDERTLQSLLRLRFSPLLQAKQQQTHLPVR
ncbi:MAG: hypothetical protein ACRAVC_15660 [Trichormus sp.]